MNTVAQRLTAKLVPAESGCIEWVGHRHRGGHGMIMVGSKREGTKRMAYTHRVAWELAHGPIPVGMCVCHRCDNPPCCNPDHLFLGSQADNVADMIAKGRNRSKSPRGEDNKRAIVTEQQVREIRFRYACGHVTLDALGNEFGMTRSGIWRIVKRKSWAWLPDVA